MNPILALIIANIIWGAAPPIFKLALQNIPPFTLAFIRFFFAGLIFIPFIKNLTFLKLTKKESIEFLLGTFFGITVNISFFFLGLPKSPSINSAIIASAGPVFLYFLSVKFLKEKMILKVFFGMLVSLFGVLIIILSPVIFDGRNLSLGEITGNLFFVIATLGAVLHTVFYKSVTKKMNIFEMAGVGLFIGSLTFLPFMIMELRSWSFNQLDINGWIGIIFGIFLSSALAYFLFNYGLSKIHAEEIGIFSYIDPVVAVFIAAPLLHEYPTVHFFLGAILVFVGIFFAEGRIHWHPWHKLKLKLK